MKTSKYVAAAALFGGLLFAGCGATDAGSGKRDTGSARAIINMPNHFNNVAHKCYHGNGVYVTNNNGNGGTGSSLYVAVSDPVCKRGK